MFELPSTTQRSLPSHFARTGPSGSGCGVSVIVDVSHVGAAQVAPEPVSSLRRTRARITMGVWVFGYRNVSFALVVSPFSATGVPLSCDHSNFAAPTEEEAEASSVRGRVSRAGAPAG